MRLVAIILALAAAGGTVTVSTAPAHAHAASVNYADLDLASSAGRATLSARIDGAADRVCGRMPSAGLSEISSVRQCRADAIASAWNQITAVARSGMISGAR